MNFVLKTLRAAEEDALEAALWYDDRDAGLGDDFLDEVDAAVQSLRENALLHRVRFADVRRAPVPRFKYYGVYFIIRSQEVWVIAIFHGCRHPRWLEQRRKIAGE
jgi:plasmid stabilization system protein ParE